MSDDSDTIDIRYADPETLELVAAWLEKPGPAAVTRATWAGRLKKEADNIRASGDHVVVRYPLGFGCNHCGDEFLFHPVAPGMPRSVPVDVYIGASKAYAARHSRCEPSAAGDARYQYTTPDEWFVSWDTGLASLAIYAHFTQRSLSEVYSPRFAASGLACAPDGEGALAKCHRLLAVAPEWRARIAELGERWPEWKPFTDRWDEHEARWRANPRPTTGKLYVAASAGKR